MDKPKVPLCCEDGSKLRVYMNRSEIRTKAACHPLEARL